MTLFELFENMGGSHQKGGVFSNNNRKGYEAGEDIVSKREAEARRQIIANRLAAEKEKKDKKVDEAKTAKKKLPPPPNPVAKNAKTSGAGSHSHKKYNRKEKHKDLKKDE